jgi:hypothetical protein
MPEEGGTHRGRPLGIRRHAHRETEVVLKDAHQPLLKGDTADEHDFRRGFARFGLRVADAP